MGGTRIVYRSPLVVFLNANVQPVVRLEGRLCVFPGIPRLFQGMLNGLTPFLPLPPPSERPFRQQVFTPYVDFTLFYFQITQ